MIQPVVDLRDMFGPVRDQGKRPTCLAFAASDTHAGLRPNWEALSCEYAFYNAQRRAGRPPSSGALISAMLEGLEKDGQPVEGGWPYMNETPKAGEPWLPPQNLGALFRRTSSGGSKELDAIIAALGQQVPTILLTTLSRSFFLPTIEGLVEPASDEMPEPARRHAIVAVGHGECAGQRVLLVRNSWGSAWGLNGYAWLTESFLKPRVFATAVLKGDVDVSSSSIAA